MGIEALLLGGSVLIMILTLYKIKNIRALNM